jgi:hypothetical protein
MTESQQKVEQFPNSKNDPLKALKQAVDPKLIRQREGWRDRNGNAQMVDYVEWHTVADILDETAPTWMHTVKDMREIGDIFTVTVAITIEGITREGIGTGASGSEMGIKKAEHDALKRAAVKFGVARELYKKESEIIEREGSPSNTFGSNKPDDPTARSLSDLITAKQLGMIRAVAREKGIDEEELCQEEFSVSIDVLSKKAASYLIQTLQENEPEKPKDNVQSINPVEGKFTAGQTKQIADWREEMENGLKAVGVKPDLWLAKYDSDCKTFEKKEFAFGETMKAVISNKRSQTTEALANQPWDEKEIEDQYKKFGFTGGLNNASAEQIEKMWASYKDSRMI